MSFLDSSVKYKKGTNLFGVNNNTTTIEHNSVYESRRLTQQDINNVQLIGFLYSSCPANWTAINK